MTGGQGVAVLVYRSGNEWKHEVLLEDSALLHAACIGEFDPDHAGPEVFVAGYSLRAHVLSGAGRSGIPLSGPGKAAVPFRGGVAVACKDGTIAHVKTSEGAWKTEELDRAPSGQSRIGCDGDRLIASRDDGVLAIIEGGRRTEIHKEDSKLRGAVFGDFDPRTDRPRSGDRRLHEVDHRPSRGRRDLEAGGHLYGYGSAPPCCGGEAPSGRGRCGCLRLLGSRRGDLEQDH